MSRVFGGRDAALFGIAATFRTLALMIAIATGRFPEFWEQEYAARNILDGHGLMYPFMGETFHGYLDPLYPLLIAAVYAVTARSVLALGLVHVVLSALVAVVGARLAERTFGRDAAVPAGMLVALHPALIGYTPRFHPLVVDTLLITLVAFTAVRLLQAPGMKNVVAFGLALGACLLTRPTVLVAAGPLLAWAALRRPSRAVAMRWLAGFAIAAALLAPWVVRNYVVLDTFVVGRTSGPWLFWLGNHPGAGGSAGDPADPAAIREHDMPQELRDRVRAARGEIAKNRIFRDEALAYVRAEPGAFVTRTVQKLYYFWWFAPYQGRRYPAWQFWVYAGFYVVILAAAAAGLVAARRRWLPVRGEALAVVLTVMLCVSFAQALFYVEGRHRLAVEPLLIVLSGAGLAAVARRARPPARPGV